MRKCFCCNEKVLDRLNFIYYIAEYSIFGTHGIFFHGDCLKKFLGNGINFCYNNISARSLCFICESKDPGLYGKEYYLLSYKFEQANFNVSYCSSCFICCARERTSRRNKETPFNEK
jgi:hypothetical protein